MTKRFTPLGSIGFEIGPAYDLQKKANVTSKLFTLTVYIDGVRKELVFTKQDAQNIFNTIQSTWKKNF